MNHQKSCRLIFILTLWIWIFSPLALEAQDAPGGKADDGKTAQALPKPEASGSPSEAPAGADHTITLTKVVEVYEFEDLKVAVDQYKVGRGDSLVRLLKQRGLIKSRQDEAKLLRLVKSLNPELEDFNNLQVGQTLVLPSLPTEAVAAAGLTMEGGETAPPNQEAPAAPATVTETVKVYNRPQDSQQDTKVVSLRHRPGTTADPAPAAPEATAPETTPPAASPAEADPAAQPPAGPEGQGTAQAAPETSPASPGSPAAALDFPSGNAGPLAVAPESQVVYRTVRVRRGDTLERLLRREGLHRDVIYSHLLKVTLELNPEIKDPNLIFLGAEIKIPAAGDYLRPLAGIDPEAVKTAAAAVHERRRPVDGGAGRGASRRAAVLELPEEKIITARGSLTGVFARLGEKVENRGPVMVKAGDSALELNTVEFPLIELAGGGHLVLDIGSRLAPELVKTLRSQSPPYQVFRIGKKENLDQVLGRLWPMCSYFRVYGRDRAYEGGGDIRLKITADWMIWKSEEAWNSGQPLVINRVTREDRRSSPAWVNFLKDHGIQVVDIYRNSLLPDPERSPAAPLPQTELNDRNPTLFAAELVKGLGFEPRVGVQLDLAMRPGETAAPNLTAPVLWENGKTQVVLEFGELSVEAVATLTQNGYRVVTSRKDSEAVVNAVIAGFGLTAADSFVLEAPAGGPKMSLAIKGKLVALNSRKFLITNLTLPSGLASLLGPDVHILKY